MNCKEAIDLAEEAMDKDLPRAIKRRLDLHLSRCESCRRLFEAERAEHVRWFRVFNDPSAMRRLPPGFANRLVASARRPRHGFWFRLPRWLKRVACFAALLSGAAFAATVVVDAVTAKNGDSNGPEGIQATEGTDGSGALAASAEVITVADAPYVPDTASVPSDENKPSTDNQLGNNEGENGMTIKQKTATALAAAALTATPFMIQAAGMPLLQTAENLTYTWPNVGSEIVIEYDTTDATKVKSITATVAAGKTVTLTGSVIDFAANACIKLSGPGDFVIENDLVGVNGLMVTNAENACILDYKEGLLPSKTFKTIFPGVNLDDITVLYGDQRPENGIESMYNNQIHYPKVVRRFVRDGVKMMSLQMQIQYTTSGQKVTKCVAVEMKQAVDGVAARVVAACYPESYLEGEDLLNLYALWQNDPDPTVNVLVHDVAVKASDSGGTYGIGALTASWSGAPSVKLKGDLSGIGGALMVAKGASVDMVEAVALPSDQNVNGQFIVGNADVSFSGTMAGANDGALVMAATKSGDYTVTLEGAFNNTMTYTDESYWNPVKTGARGHVVIRGSSDGGARMTCKLQSNNGMPANGAVEVRDGGVLEFSAGLGSQNGTLRQNGTSRYHVYTGGVLRVVANHAFYNKMDMAIELHGGILEKRRQSGASTENMNLYCNNLLLEDGAQVNGDPDAPNMRLWVGNVDATWKVRGSSASFCNVPVQYVGTKMHTIDVADVTGDELPDFVCARTIGTQESNSGASTVRKIGLGTILCTNDVDIVGGLTVICGTWQLGSSNIWKNNRALTLNGGTFAVSNGTANVIGALTVGPRGGTIKLADGASLSFLDSHASAWDGILVIEGFSPNAIRFGTNDAGLDDAQCKKLRTLTGKKLTIAPNGYLQPQGTVLIIR